MMMKSLVVFPGGRQCLDVLVFSPVELADRKNTNPCQSLAKVLLHAEQLVSWSLTSLFSRNMAVSETKGQGWKVIRTQ